MSPANYGRIAVLILAIAVALIAYGAARKSLRDLLSRTISVPSGVDFYMRSFLLLLVFGIIGQGVTSGLDLKPGERFMEYVWAVAGGLGSALDYAFGIVAIYLVLMTILIATLKPKNDK